MKKKVFLFLLIIVITLIVINFKLVKKVFSYYSGIGTPYCYFEAKKHCNDTLLVYYYQGEFFDLSTPAIDSLQRCYGFSGEYPNEVVAHYIIDFYNSIVFQEIKHRVGENKWKEYKFREDSICKSVVERYK